MRKIFIISLWIVVLLNKTALSQSESINWKELFKEHGFMHIIVDEYLDEFDVSMHPFVYVDSLVILSPSDLSSIPIPIEGIEKFASLIEYPEFARRAGVSRDIVVSVIVDTTGKTMNAEVIFGSYELFHGYIFSALNKTKFIPAIKNNKPIESRVAIAISFVLKRNINIGIDTLIVTQNGGLENCPLYTIKLCNNGDVIYDGFSNVDKLGKWKSTLRKEEFEGLSSLIFSVDFFSMEDEYRSYANDLSWVSISVKADTSSKKVDTNYYLPVLEIGKLINYLTKDLDWEKYQE